MCCGLSADRRRSQRACNFLSKSQNINRIATKVCIPSVVVAVLVTSAAPFDVETAGTNNQPMHTTHAVIRMRMMSIDGNDVHVFRAVAVDMFLMNVHSMSAF